MISTGDCHCDHSDKEFLSLIITSQRLPIALSYHQITALNLSNLQLTLIDSFPFACFPKLHSLDLSHNQLTFIDSDWSKYSNHAIDDLNLSYNYLDTLLCLKDFKYLKQLNVTENRLRPYERCLSFYLCSTLECMIDKQTDQSDNDRLQLDRLLQATETNVDRLWSMSYRQRYIQGSQDVQLLEQLTEEIHQSIMTIMENEHEFSQFYLSPSANHLVRRTIEQVFSSTAADFKCKSSLTTHLTDQFHLSIGPSFQPVQFLRSHHQSDDDLTTVPVRACAFEPNVSTNILATCGGEKVCFIDCDSCTITHVFEVKASRSATSSNERKRKELKPNKTTDYFSCLCWIELAEQTSIVAVGATNGHIYLISPTWKLMFGHIELPASSVTCVTWHASDPYILMIGSSHTVRCVNIRSYIDRLQAFIRKQNTPAARFDYVDTHMFLNRIDTTHLYNLRSGYGPSILITDLLFYPLSDLMRVLLVGTTAGLFLIRYEGRQDQSLIQLAFPKSLWTMGEYIESLRVIDDRKHVIAMNILGLDRICCFDLERSFRDQRIHVIRSLANPCRRIPTKMGVISISLGDQGDHLVFECVVGSDHGSFFYHQIQTQTNTDSPRDTYTEILWPSYETCTAPTILSASINECYLVLTTSNNLVCIYKRH